MKKAISIFFLFMCSLTYGQKVDVANFPKFIQPGQHFSLFFSLSHTDSLTNDFESTLSLPLGWVILTEKKREIRSDSFVRRYNYTISIPSHAVGGVYPLDFQITEGGKIFAQKKIFVRVSDVRHLEIQPLSQPEFVKEGDILKVEYLIQNLGNKTERVKLETSRGVVANIKDSATILPNSYLKVFVEQKIPQTDNEASWQTTSDLKLTFDDQATPLYRAVSVPVYATKVKKNDPYLRFPIEFGAVALQYAVGQQSVRAYQYFADGRGFLDFTKKHYLNFSIRGPNQAAFPSMGNYDQYTLFYSYLGKTAISVGDYVLRFNNLMEFGRFGRGIKIEQMLSSKTNFTAFYQQTRFVSDQKDAFGGNYTVKLKGESFIGLNYISKNLVQNKGNFTSNIVGFSSFLKNKSVTNETEIALGEARKVWDIGFFNKCHFVYKQWQLNSEVIHAGKDFYGFYTNSFLFVNGLNYFITKKINIGINRNITKINPSLDIIKYAISPYSSSTTAFMSFQPNARNLFFFNYTQQEREDRQKPSQYHFKENFANFSYNLNTSKWTLFAQYRYGYAQNLKITDNIRPKKALNYMIQPSVALWSGLWIGGYFEYQLTSKFSANDTYQNLCYYGGNIRFNYKKNISFNFMYRNNYAPDELFEKRSFVDGSMVLDFEKHQFSLNTGRSYFPNLAQNEQNTFFLSAKYVLKLHVPIKKDKKLGQLRGQIVGLSKEIKKEGILLQLGQYKVLTDSNGGFSFPNLMPNTYYLTMPITSNLVGVVSTLKMPIEVRVKADSMAFLTIPLIKTGAVIGAVNFENRQNNNVEKPIIYLKLYNAQESFITELNKNNAFSFKEMKPGLWKLKAILVGKTEQFEILNPEQEVEIVSNETKNCVFSVKVMERKIQFSGKNFHISSQK